jgi:hypothetical protein
MAASSSVDIRAMRSKGDGAVALSLTSSATGPTDVIVDYEIEVSPNSGSRFHNLVEWEKVASTGAVTVTVTRLENFN